MNHLTVYFLIFAFMQMNVLGNAKCRKKGQAAKEAAKKSEQLQGKQDKTSSQKSPMNQNETSNIEKIGPFDPSSEADARKEDDKTEQTNATQTGRYGLPSDLNFPKELSFPADSNSPGQPDLSREETELGYNGYLYDVFKKRLNQVFRELYHNLNGPGVTAPPPQVEYEIEKPKKRSAVSNCLYEEFKRRLDKFNNEFMEPAKAIKRTSGEITSEYGNGVSGSGKRSTVQENLYEEYKRRLDKLGNELWFDGEKVFDRSGRGATNKLPLKTLEEEHKPKRTETDKAAQQDFYEAYKKKLDQLTRELYQKSNECICRTYTQLTAEDLTSPTLQRLVEAVQSDEEKSIKGDSRDGSGSFQGSNILLKIDKAIDNLDKQEGKRSLGAYDLGTTIFGADSLNFMTGAANGVGATAAATYPAVLTKTVDANLGLLGTAPKNMLAAVASKMNMSTLDLAKKLASMSNPLNYVAKKDPQLGEEVQKLIDFSINNKPSQSPTVKKSPLHEVSIVSGLPLLGPDPSGVPSPLITQDALFGTIPALAPASASAPAPPSAPPPASTSAPIAAPGQTQDACRPKPVTKSQPSAVNGASQPNEAEAARIAGVLDKVLSKLELMQQCKVGANAEPEDDNCEPDGITCDVVGSWNSYEMGLRFDIALTKAADRRLGMAEKNNMLLTIDVGERVPPHAHHILDTSWKFMGSALNQQGGPFYFYTQNREFNTVATFIGFCRVCDGIDTIFGSWTIMGPSKDCQDVTTSLENKRDIFRRYNMESKRNKHFKDKLFEKSKYSNPDK